MKTSKKNQQLAKKIFKSCLKSGLVDETKLKKYIELLTKKPTSETKEILTYLMKLIENFEKNKELILESPFEISDGQISQIQTLFEKLLNKKLLVNFRVNKDLIGGIKVKNADFQWENSISSNLIQMKGAHR